MAEGLLHAGQSEERLEEELNLEICPQLLVPTLNVPAARRLQLKRQTCGFTALQTSEIEISDVSQWKQHPQSVILWSLC